MNRGVRTMNAYAKRSRIAGLLLVARLSCAAAGSAAEPTYRDIEYARAGDQVLALDLYLPPKPVPRPVPLIVWVHGGAWRSGSKSGVPITPLVPKGYAIASVDYRLTPVAPFPANVHDLKAAIRFLRAHHRKHGLDPDRFIIAGSSAGAHLAALVGVSNGHAELEGTIGDHRSQSSAVHAIVSFFGASNLESILGQSTPHGLSVRVPALQLLLGGQPADRPALARLASPIAHVDRRDPPLLLIHGDADPQMPFAQSEELHRAYRAVGRPVQLVPIAGGVHGGQEFFDETRLRLLTEFLREHGLAPAAGK